MKKNFFEKKSFLFDYFKKNSIIAAQLNKINLL